MRRTRHGTGILFAAALVGGCMGAEMPHYDHVVVVVEENHNYSQIIGSTSAPYINSLAVAGALFTNSLAIEHPSQPNYLDLYSGSNQGVTTDNKPANLFKTINLGGSLFSKGLTFGGYSESLPSIGFTGTTYTTVSGQNQYVRKHNPWVNWQDSTANSIPQSANMRFSDFPSDFSLLPTVSFVVPNEQDDMHDGTVAVGDTWLKTHLDAYVTWAKTHNSLLIVTFDENGSGSPNKVATIFDGANVIPGQYSETINHYNVLRTIEDIYGLPYAGSSATATPITDVFSVPEPSPVLLLFGAGLGFALLRKWEGRRKRRPTAACGDRG